MKWKKRGSRERYVAALAIMATLAMVLMPVAAASGPWIEVLSHTDGEHVTTKEVRVHGTAVAPQRTINFEGEDLVHGQMAGIKWVNNNLTYRPELVFGDQFNGILDPKAWPFIQDPQNVSLTNGALKLDFAWAWPSPESNDTMVKSKDFTVPEGVDFQATYRLKTSSYGYSGGGGGISDGSTDVWNSHLATLAFWSGGFPATWMRVIAGGEALHNSSTYDFTYHDYTTTFDYQTGRYTAYRDDEALGGYEMETMPTNFWFGHTEDLGMYDMRPIIEVDFVEVWATSGEWISDVIDIGHYTALDGADLAWNSSHKKDAKAILEVRASEDEENWTEWIPFEEDGSLATSVNASYYQLRLSIGIPGVLKETAHVTVTGINMRYHDPLVGVDVRHGGIDWLPAEGLEEWNIDLLLSEDWNQVEVRVTDTSGTANITTLDILVDTTHPTGTMEIQGDLGYTNDPNITLVLNATDKYGVEWMDISHFSDFSERKRLPYSEQAEWQLSGVEGVSMVYVRFIDTHGLSSPGYSDSVFYDSLPPHGSIVIDGDALYTSGHVVQLELSYSDNVLVELVELSNDPLFTDPYQVPKGETTVSDWQLAEGGDGDRHVYIRVTDVAGNMYMATDDIELYIPKPVGTVTIDGGADLTGQTVVSLTIVVPLEAHVRLMQVSNDPSFEGATWDTVEEEHGWILEDGDGEKTVYVRFIDNRDIESVPVSDSIRLDQTAPTLNVTINGGSLYTTVQSVQVEVGYEDPSGPVLMWLSDDGTFDSVRPQDFVPELGWTIPARESDHWIYVRVEDEAGNVGEGSDMIHFATIIPVIMLALPDGEVVQAVEFIPVEVTPVDPYGGIEVQAAFDDDPDHDEPWTPLNGLLQVPVPYGVQDGSHTIRVRARNAAGLVSEVTSIEVTVDTVAPALEILKPKDGSKFPQKGLQVILEVEAADGTHISSVAYAVDGGIPHEMTGRELTANITLGSFGDHTIEVVAEDVAGNVAISISNFTVQDADAMKTGPGTSILILIALALLVATGVAGYTLNRRMTPGLRPVAIEDGDGWHEDWDHPHLEECDDEDKRPCHLNVVPTDPVYQARKAREAEKATQTEPAEATGPELEKVDLPEELRSEGPAVSGEDDWSEF
jgi:hypothetical protein